MHTCWRVDEVTERPGVVLVNLIPVTWFKTNPEYTAWLERESHDPAPEEFVDAYPGEDDAKFIMEGGPSITLDLTEGPELHPRDNVMIAMTVCTTAEPGADLTVSDSAASAAESEG